MTGAFAANRAIAQLCDKTRTELRLTAAVMQQARSCWNVKTRLHLAEITGYSVRACESWLAGDRKLPADALAALIRSEWGLNFLSVVMAESRVPWWRRLLRINLTASVLRRQAADRRLLEKTLREDDELSDALARAEVACTFRDEEFHRPFLDAVEQVRCTQDRPMVGVANRPKAPRRA